MSYKGFKTIDEQISILKNRGLNIVDIDTAKDFLLRNNYYRISGYSLTLRDHDAFFENASFQNIIDIYEFDHRLRHILMKYIEVIEVTVKSVYSYEFSKSYGAFAYLDPSLFSDSAIHYDIMQKAEAQKNSRLPHEAYLKHFINDLKIDIPLWAFVDLLTISNISFLYKISPVAVKLSVANAFGFKSKGDELLERFMHFMTILRNLCAHGSRLYNRLFEQKPWLNKKELALLTSLPDGTKDNSHLFGYILIMRRLLKPSDFNHMKSEIESLSRVYSFVDLSHYGFNKNWSSLL